MSIKLLAGQFHVWRTFSKSQYQVPLANARTRELAFENVLSLKKSVKGGVDSNAV